MIFLVAFTLFFREVCTEVQTQCKDVIDNTETFTWPAVLNCDDLPSQDDPGSICIGPGMFNRFLANFSFLHIQYIQIASVLSNLTCSFIGYMTPFPTELVKNKKNNCSPVKLSVSSVL